ncbi:hypothetical protein GLYMA_03G095200v4 [Glycine max]|uniref:Uncharacterized protein n=2 Tax=Glycine subgen. Soja TaxID=1462606 RepID=K7KE14_SOYBN|nr:hypothetical protein JHK87_006817 [Glycine soja]KAG5054670.1 hypothetical protein JHK85_007180 [Glycine max]KAG5071769.1 hypothetical protein JHK86_006980 [Glycine max]KAH1069264.1 hypothetical protein GYH30_006746 [Glycine max]KHN01745.1 hypothetical protein glysoja_043874 [Glycine soja]
MASNSISFTWVVFFLCVFGLLCARATSLNLDGASEFHASSYEKAQRRRLFAQQRKLLAKSDRPCCHNYRP